MQDVEKGWYVGREEGKGGRVRGEVGEGAWRRVLRRLKTRRVVYNFVLLCIPAETNSG